MFEKLKKEYYEKEILSEDELNGLRQRAESLYINNGQIRYKSSIKDSTPYAFYDIEGNIDFIIYLLNDINIEKNVKLIADSNNEYYRFHYFYDAVTGLLPRDLAKICIIKNDIPITNFILMNDIKDVKCDAEYEFSKGENMADKKV